jgi:hypothetical protein
MESSARARCVNVGTRECGENLNIQGGIISFGIEIPRRVSAPRCLQASCVMSAKPPALAKFKSPIVWEQIWQKYLDNLYTKTPISVLKSSDKPSILESAPESTINAALEAAHDALCRLQRDIFHFAAEKCAEDDFERKWRVAGPKTQERCYFEAIKRICDIPGMEKQRQYVELCSMPSSRWASILFFSPQVRSRDQSSYFPGEERAGLH